MLERQPEFMQNDLTFDETRDILKIKSFINHVDDQFGWKKTPKLKIPVEASMRKDFAMPSQKLKHYQYASHLGP